MTVDLLKNERAFMGTPLIKSPINADRHRHPRDWPCECPLGGLPVIEGIPPCTYLVPFPCIYQVPSRQRTGIATSPAPATGMPPVEGKWLIDGELGCGAYRKPVLPQSSSRSSWMRAISCACSLFGALTYISPYLTSIVFWYSAMRSIISASAAIRANKGRRFWYSTMSFFELWPKSVAPKGAVKIAGSPGVPVGDLG